MTKQRISKKPIRKEAGYLYFVDKQGDISRVPRKGKKGRRNKVLKLGINKMPGYLYYVDKAGYVATTKMNRGGRKSNKR